MREMRSKDKDGESRWETGFDYFMKLISWQKILRKLSLSRPVILQEIKISFLNITDILPAYWLKMLKQNGKKVICIIAVQMATYM